ncbi:MAG: S-layer homology domain-containing protein, partial [Oscillibacter sp.]|nr:S-layer homology domain-containing protein [Oscillibacter sp.]
MRKTKKRAAVCAFLLAALCLLGTARASEHPFSDVEAGAYYESAVVWALNRGVTTGVTATAFEPNGTCNRGQVVTFLWRAKGKPAPQTAENPFTDVSPSDYCYEAVLWAVENGITNGTGATTFSPKNPCSRAHVLTFLHRAMGQPAAAGESALAAAYDEGAYYKSAVAWADAGGLLANMSGAPFSVSENCPRSDIVTYLFRFFEGAEADNLQTSASYVKLTPQTPSAFRFEDVPPYSGAVFSQVHGGEPYFSAENLSASAYELYGELDA